MRAHTTRHRAIVVLGVLPAFLGSRAFGLGTQPVRDRVVYCVGTRSGELKLQGYPPLIDLAHGTSFVQAMYEGQRLALVRVRRFTPDYELVFEYKFDHAGKLAALRGLLQRWGRWLGEADLFPQPDGTVKKPWVRYTVGSGRDATEEPDDAGEYTGAFMQVKVYRNVDEIPCAELLRQAGKNSAAPR